MPYHSRFQFSSSAKKTGASTLSNAAEFYVICKGARVLSHHRVTNQRPMAKKIYTRTGDDGTTGLFGAGRVPKTHPRIRAYGAVDETNAAIGLACAEMRDDNDLKRTMDILTRIQGELFVLGGDLASPEATKYPVPRIERGHVEALEKDIDGLTEDLPELKRFILPGGSPAAAALHLARTTCRRAERTTVDAIEQDENISDAARLYLNRLSDLLFTLARWVNRRLGIDDLEWQID